jgi:predicted transcriptional regulator
MISFEEVEETARSVVADIIETSSMTDGQSVRIPGVARGYKGHDLRHPAEAIVAAVDAARQDGDLSMVVEKVRGILNMRISEIEARKSALELALKVDGVDHVKLAAKFYTFLTGRDPLAGKAA